MQRRAIQDTFLMYWITRRLVEETEAHVVVGPGEEQNMSEKGRNHEEGG